MQKVKRLFRQPFFFTAKSVLEKIPGIRIQLARFYVLQLSTPKGIKMRGFGVIRQGTPGDVVELSRLENKPYEVFSRRFKEGDFCLVAEDAEKKIIGYAWYTLKYFHTEERFNYRLTIPQDAIYGYDGFIDTRYRLRGTWVLFQKRLLEEAREASRMNLVTCIDYGNSPSIKAHLRFGYAPIKDVLIFSIMGKCFSREKSLESIPIA